MATNNLPVELWLIIFSFAEAFKFSSNDLAALCQVCTYFHYAVVDSLYESITVDNSHVCTTLAERPHLAEKVKSFIFTFSVRVGQEVHLDNLTLALKNMTRLSTLKLIHSKGCHSSVLRYCAAKLHVFHCTYYIDFQFVSFLNRQDSIHNLFIAGDHTNWTNELNSLTGVLRTSLPHLTEVSATPLFLNVLIPGRPVHTVRFKGQHTWAGQEQQLGRTIAPSTSIKNLGLDLTVWFPLFQFECPSIPKHVEEITLTGFATQDLTARGGPGIDEWGSMMDFVLNRALNLKRLTFWFEGKREDAYSWARLLFLVFHNTLSRLEHVSCVVAGPDVKTAFESSSGCFLIRRSEDNRTRGHRAANDVRELMPLPVLCCKMQDNLCDAYSSDTIQLNRKDGALWKHCG